MRPIVCATRGGEASRRTQEHAIALAKKRGEDLIVLYVADCGFAGPLPPNLETAVNDELMRLGRSLASIAKVRAQEQGVKAQVVVFCGEVQKAIQEYLRQVDASTLVIGASRPTSEEEPSTRRSVDEFAEAIRQATGVEVIVVGPEDRPAHG